MAINKDQFPNTYKLLSQYLKKEMTKQLPAGAHQLTDALSGEALADMAFRTNGKILYEFYDAYNLYPGVYKVPMGWKWQIEGTFPMSGNSGSRIEGEGKAFEECAKRLENL